MQLILVGTRKGQRVIHWPGVIATSLLICVVPGGASMLLYFLLSGTWSFFAGLMTTLLLLFGVVIVNVHRALQLPADQLRPLD